MKAVKLAALMGFWVSSAWAQDAPTLAETMGGLAGKEVRIDGVVARSDQGGYTAMIGMGGTPFPVDFGLSRDDLRVVEECLDGALWDGRAPDGCRVVGLAELRPDGSQIGLLIFEVFEAPEPAQ